MSDKVGNVPLCFYAQGWAANKVRGSWWMNMDTMKIVHEVEKCLCDVAERMQNRWKENPRQRIGNGEWTKEILYSLYKLSKSASLSEEDKISACPTFDEPWKDGEWLYDMVWYRDLVDSVPGRSLGLHRALKDVVMVLESEWSHSAWDIQYDFEKLLVAKAPIKVMIIDDVDDKIVECVIGDGLKAFKGGFPFGEVYLVAQYSNKTSNFTFRTFQA